MLYSIDTYNQPSNLYSSNMKCLPFRAQDLSYQLSLHELSLQNFN